MDGEDPANVPEYDIVEEDSQSFVTMPGNKIQDGWASGWCEKCHKRYTNAPMVDGIIYAPCHNKL